MQPTSFLVSLTDLKRTAGARKDLSLFAAYNQSINVGLVCLPAGREISIDVVLESVGDGVLVSATAELTLDCQCSRCLTQFSQEITTDIQELFVYPEREQEYEEEDVRRIQEERIDLGPPIRDAVILDQPLNPLCIPDCRGLCPQCGTDLNTDPFHDHGEGVDSRWLTLTEWGKIS